jgi:hypothetical protein
VRAEQLAESSSCIQCVYDNPLRQPQQQQLHYNSRAAAANCVTGYYVDAVGRRGGSELELVCGGDVNGRAMAGKLGQVAEREMRGWGVREMMGGGGG